MGTFLGHLIPGSFFLLFALWWIFAVLNRYYKAKYKKGPAYRSTCTYACSCCCGCCGKFQWEGLLKVACCSLGLAAELVTAFDKSATFAYFGNAQHATMYSFFGFSGVVDLMLYFKAPLPKNADYVFAALCFIVEGVLFKFHLHGRTKVDVVVHTLLLYVVWCCAASVLAELRHQRSVLPALARCFFVALQGSWFIQVGAMLYPPAPWLKSFEEGDEHTNVMLATVVFAWHAFAIFVLCCAAALLVNRRHSRDLPPGDRREVSMERLIKSDGLSDLDSDAEFEADAGNNGRLLGTQP